ncbi:hexosaminidase [Pedobacter cryoconitis]|uniref:family 20 glycosylhydrolase n=1 Tax=Pedobacter cryoconitis TaxID=188932 RepID=UPI0016164B9A|nr:family 20 glycosylhydrolase [Pedobacter cryoconitis]MBB6271327.1 hexosaminidase [Pedobacter cryoconitis]
MRFKKCLLLAFLLPLVAAAQKGSTSYPVKDLHVKWTFKENQSGGKKQSLSLLTFLNKSAQKFPASNWSLYFNSMKDIELKTSDQLIVEQVNGDLFRIRPGKGFKEINKGDSVVLNIPANDEIVNFADAPGGLYLVWDNMPDKGIKIDHYVVEDVERYIENVVTPLETYNKNSKFSPLEKNKLIKLLPTPVFYEARSGNFSISQATAIITDPDFKKEADYLSDELYKLFKFKTSVSTGTSKDKSIRLVKTNLPENEYQLEITPQSITLSASNAEGVFYGLQSLKSLILANSPVKNEKGLVSAVSIKDAPRFKYRALMLDVARNFHPKEEVLRILDLMALYKLNVFHFHVTDDEAWRLAIPALPELTEIGAKRGHTLTNEKSLQATYSSGPDTTEVLNKAFYTTADFVEILKYAAKRHIQVIPEIETPGHARAAIKAMDTRYNRFMAKGMRAEAEKYLLRDINDKSVYSSAQYWNDNIVCVALPSVYTFLDKVTESLQDMYRAAGVPLTTIHFGGDEVPQGVWEKSPLCLELVKQAKMKSTDDLWGYYVGKLQNILKPKGIILSGWEEFGMMKTYLDGNKLMVPNPLFANDPLQLDVWNNVIGGGTEDLPYRLANGGYKVVLTCSSNFYLDMAYNRSLTEPGHYWAGFVNMEKLFSFIPYDYYKNAKEDRRGQAISKSLFVGKDRLTDFGKSNILGLKAALWTEKIRNTELLEFMLLPRLVGFAERAWAKDPAWALEKDEAKSELAYQDSYADFKTRVGLIEFPKLDEGGWNYRIPPVGVKITDGEISANTEFPGFNIYYTTNGKEPSAKDHLYTKPIKEKGLIKLKAYNAKGRGGNTTSIQN